MKKENNFEKDSIEQNDIEAKRAKVKELLAKAKESVSPSLTPNEDKEANIKAIEKAKKIISDNEDLDVTDDPDLKHNLFYKGIQPIFRRLLPEGNKYKDLREHVHAQKKKFLNRGRVEVNGYTGSDSRMAYNSDMKELLKEIQHCVENEEGVAGILSRLEKLNERYEN